MKQMGFAFIATKSRQDHVLPGHTYGGALPKQPDISCFWPEVSLFAPEVSDMTWLPWFSMLSFKFNQFLYLF